VKSKYLYPDFETRSAIDIKKVSTDRYASHPSTRVLMCSFAFDDGPVDLWQEGDSRGWKRCSGTSNPTSSYRGTRTSSAP
jgi:hypothetical protein